MLTVKVFVVVLLAGCVLADMKDMKDVFSKSFMECAKEYEVTDAEREQLKNKQIPTREGFKCALACAYKKTGMMDAQGKIDVEQIKKTAREHLANDPEHLRLIEQTNDACKSVNDEAVSDGDKGCERAALLVKCSIDKLSAA